MFFKKKAKITPEEYTPIVPEGWSVQVRPQHKSYADDWDYRLTPPARIFNVFNQQRYHGSGFKTKRSAIVGAVDQAEFVERMYRNELEKWETV